MKLSNISVEQIQAAAGWCLELAVTRAVLPANLFIGCQLTYKQAFADEIAALLTSKEFQQVDGMDAGSECIYVSRGTTSAPSLMMRALQRVRTDLHWKENASGGRISFAPDGKVFAAMGMGSLLQVYPQCSD